VCTAVIIVERRHHFHRELVIASVLATIAIVAIILSTLYAWILWRRSRRLPDGKGARSSGLPHFSGLCLSSFLILNWLLD
jgi:hypothetical protein